MSASASSLDVLSEDMANDIGRLQDSYVMHEQAQVAAFIDEHSHLAPLLLKARHVINTYFGPSTGVVLEVVTDPEEGDQALFARIETDLPARQALQQLDRIWETWWLDALPAAHGLMHLDIRSI